MEVHHAKQINHPKEWHLDGTKPTPSTNRLERRLLTMAKEFATSFDEIEKTQDGYLVIGCCSGDEPICLGDFLNDLEVVRIESYGKEFNEIHPGFTARLTLSTKFREQFKKRVDETFDNFPLKLSALKSEWWTKQMWPKAPE